MITFLKIGNNMERILQCYTAKSYPFENNFLNIRKREVSLCHLIPGNYTSWEVDCYIWFNIFFF